MNRAEYIYGRHFKARQARPNDLPYISSHLREGDRLELERFYDESPEEVLTSSFLDSRWVWTAVSPDGTPVAMWGVAAWPQDDRFGCPWLLGTDYIKESASDFLWLSKHFDKIMSSRFVGLANMVDAEYAEALRWLSWLGYRRGVTVKSKKGYDFITMYKGNLNVW